LHIDPVEQIARFLARLDPEGHHVAVRRAKLHHATQIARQPVQHGGRAISDYLLFIEMAKQSQSLRTGQVQSAPLLREIRVRDEGDPSPARRGDRRSQIPRDRGDTVGRPSGIMASSIVSASDKEFSGGVAVLMM
jgi:hypothetical protein